MLSHGVEVIDLGICRKVRGDDGGIHRCRAEVVERGYWGVIDTTHKDKWTIPSSKNGFSDPRPGYLRYK